MIDNTLTVGGIIYDTGYGIYENVRQGASFTETGWGVLADFACSSLPASLGLAGSVFGPVGTIGGCVVGGILSFFIDGVSYNGYDSFRDWMKSSLPEIW